MRLNIKSSYIKSICSLGIGSIIAQLFNLLSQPVLTRCLSPELLGQYAYIVNLANIIIPVASLKMDLLIVKESDDGYAQYITDSCIRTLALTALLFGVVLAMGYVLDLGKLHQYGPMLVLAVFLVIAEGLRYIFIAYSNRYKQYKLISQLAITREATRAAVQIVDALTAKSLFGQVIGHIAAPVIGAHTQIKQYLEKRRTRSALSGKQYVEILKQGKKQVFFIAPSQFMNTYAYSMIAFSVANCFSDADLGFYSISIKILGLPMAYITSNVSKVVFRRLTELISERSKTFGFILKNVVWLLVLSSAIFLVLYFVAPTACKIVFGSDYYTAGIYIRTLCLMFCLRFVSTSFAGLFTAYDYQWMELFFNGLLFVCSIAAYLIAGHLDVSILTFFKIVNLLSAAVYMLQIVSYLAVAGKSDSSL